MRKKKFVQELIHLLPPWDSGPLTDDVAAAAGDQLAATIGEDERARVFSPVRGDLFVVPASQKYFSSSVGAISSVGQRDYVTPSELACNPWRAGTTNRSPLTGLGCAPIQPPNGTCRHRYATGASGMTIATTSASGFRYFCAMRLISSSVTSSYLASSSSARP